MEKKTRGLVCFEPAPKGAGKVECCLPVVYPSIQQKTAIPRREPLFDSEIIHLPAYIFWSCSRISTLPNRPPCEISTGPAA